MTAPPPIFLYQEQVEGMWRDLSRSTPLQQCQALGMELDDGDVYHVYTSPLQTHFAGRPCVALVEVRNGDAVGDVPDADVRDVAEVVVLLGLSDGRFSGRGFVYKADGWIEGDVRIVPLKAEMYTRSAGPIETDALAKRSAAIVGLGSGGSAVAVALAQAGLGRITLIDRDRLEIGNVSRHACGVGDLGRRKTSAVRDLVLGKNPAIDVRTHDVDVNERPSALHEALEGADLVVGATDGDRSRFLLNQTVLDLGVVAVFGRVLSRATGGDVLRVRPHAGPCLACVYTKRFLALRPREYSSLREVREDSPSYVSEDDLQAAVQVGLATDIAPVSNLMTKIALVELSRHTGGGLQALEGDLQADFYVWANRREGIYESWEPMGFSFNQPSVLRWYGADLSRRDDCGACGEPSLTVPPGLFGARSRLTPE